MEDTASRTEVMTSSVNARKASLGTTVNVSCNQQAIHHRSINELLAALTDSSLFQGLIPASPCRAWEAGHVKLPVMATGVIVLKDE